jgi:hypothetical protein
VTPTYRGLSIGTSTGPKKHIRPRASLHPRASKRPQIGKNAGDTLRSKMGVSTGGSGNL